MTIAAGEIPSSGCSQQEFDLRWKIKMDHTGQTVNRTSTVTCIKQYAMQPIVVWRKETWGLWPYLCSTTLAASENRTGKAGFGLAIACFSGSFRFEKGLKRGEADFSWGFLSVVRMIDGVHERAGCP